MYVYRGGPSGISPAAPLVVPAPGASAFPSGAFGVFTGVTGDVDGDGFFDVLVGALSNPRCSIAERPAASPPSPLVVTGGAVTGGFGSDRPEALPAPTRQHPGARAMPFLRRTISWISSAIDSVRADAARALACASSLIARRSRSLRPISWWCASSGWITSR